MIGQGHLLGSKVWRVTRSGMIPVILRSIDGDMAKYRMVIGDQECTRTGKLHDLFPSMFAARDEFRRRRKAARLTEQGITV